MKFASSKVLSASFAIAAAALTLTMAHAQSVGGSGFGNSNGDSGFGGGRKHQQRSADKAAPQKPKADEKAYAAALKGLPDKQYDPWHGVR